VAGVNPYLVESPPKVRANLDFCYGPNPKLAYL
jgi:hypothetical protein